MTTQLAQLSPRPDAPEKDRADYSIAIGLAATLLFHLLLVWVAPEFDFMKFSGVHGGISVTSANKGKTFDFQLAPDAFPKPKERDPAQFVETNSAAPENTPDKTNNFSNRNQQSAQEVAAKELDPEHRPTTKGDDKFKDSSAIVSGDMAPPQLAPAPTPEVTKDEAQARTEQKARLEQVPLEGFDKTEGKSEDGIATNIAKSKSLTTNADQLAEGAKDAKDPTGGLVAVTQSAKQQPKERPRLSSVSLNRQSPIANHIAGVANMGIIGMDARWSEYGEYLNELIEIVQAQWYSILRESRVSPPRGSHVIVTFRINSKGETEITKVEDADAGKQGVFSCQNAITYPQPYRKWSDAMIAVLGDSQELTFSFYYQ
ncbi:hypothetical protein [Opitutus sp. GAS368]|uniref:hypothetical protein n=1 Tax=Opitutus sp. GAS368 TaxID=1882749 RepID=UPI00087C5925|nr:hypothetical protein [Opitutus sp. GAS368]SDS58248.1 hypothetical protein SAMN05444173_3325 [Opitutus sp. GAS368]